MLPKDVKEKLESLKDFKPLGNASGMDFSSVSQNPQMLRDLIWPIIKMHDDFGRWAQQFKDNWVAKVLFTFSQTVDKWMFQMMAPYVKPMIQQVRQFLDEQRRDMIRKAENTAKDPDADVFGTGSKATNPTHTLLSKDHFDCVLNNPAGKWTVHQASKQARSH